MRQNNLLTLRLAQFMGHLDEKLQLELAVTTEQVRKRADRNSETDGRRYCRHGVDVTPILSEAKHIGREQEREHPLASVREVLKRLDDAFLHDEYAMRWRACLVDAGSTSEANLRRNPSKLSLLLRREDLHRRLVAAAKRR